MFVGNVLLILRPLKEEHDPNFANRLPPTTIKTEESNNGSKDLYTFYFHLQGQFKRPISKENLFVGAELADPYIMKSTMSKWTRRFADLLLRLLSMNVGDGMKYSFGGDNKGTDVILPHIAFPVENALKIETVEGSDVGSQ